MGWEEVSVFQFLLLDYWDLIERHLEDCCIGENVYGWWIVYHRNNTYFVETNWLNIIIIKLLFPFTQLNRNAERSIAQFWYLWWWLVAPFPPVFILRHRKWKHELGWNTQPSQRHKLLRLYRNRRRQIRHVFFMFSLTCPRKS